mgnify:CR=1 FL=1
MRPGDYARDEVRGAWVPLRWVRREPLESPNVKALRWLAHILERLHESVAFHRRRLTKQREEAALARLGNNSFALDEADRLRGMMAPVQGAETRVAWAASLVRGQAVGGLAPSVRLPDPFPSAPVWRAFRRDSALLLDGGAGLKDLVAGLLNSPPLMADLPFLFQRWCGLQLIEAFRELGWLPQGDPVGPLYLSGRIDLRKGTRSIELWVEPRLTREKAELIGWSSIYPRQELTPDYLIVTRSRRGRDGFVLDPTLSIDEKRHLEKCNRYLEPLQGAEPLFVAGEPTARWLQRSWVCAPLGGPQRSRLYDYAGLRGAVPLHPVDGDRKPLLAWVRDITAFAEAWS